MADNSNQPDNVTVKSESLETEVGSNGNTTSNPAVKTEVENDSNENETDITDEQIDAMEHNPFYTKLTTEGFKKLTAWEVEKLIDGQILTETDLDSRALNALREFDVNHISAVLHEFSSSDLSHVQNKSAYLCGMMKTYRQRLSLKSGKPSPGSSTAAVGPTKEQLAEILKTGYTLDITTGQRKYGGPPPNWEGGPPGNGHEVFVGRIPRDLFEDTLVPIFQKAGQIWDFRLMIDSLTGYNRGYAFCTYCTKEAAKVAVKTINDHEVQPGKKLKVNISIANVRLFAGNIPKQKSKEEIKEEFCKLTEGLSEVIVYKTPGEPNKKNRGFAFLEYDSHKNASAAKRKLGSGRCRVWGCDLIIDWADPQEEPSDEIMETVKVLYVRGLLPDVTEEMITERFEPYGKLERVRKVKDYAFIHFAERDHALQAMNDLNNQKLGESLMEISLAKPLLEKQKEKKKGREGGPFRGGPPAGPGFGRGGMRPPWHHPPMRGGYGGHGGGYADDWGYGGGYDNGWGYDGGYDDGWNYGGGFGGYDDYYRGPPPRGRPRGGVQGGPRGGGFSRGGNSMRGGPRGGGMRGGRGVLKRPMAGEPSPNFDNKKPRSSMSEWGNSPIAQQPLNHSSGSQSGSGASGAQWYQDSW